ncbi:MAG: alpha/beta hydrolase [Bacteroidetes bacterium HGW-Bacteroidetes-11]|jgi:acetyl esterase/lipase|nr:MAG: alpha/beta hydrolase [Bacteroidetes bacterium HGW-Bacteroidetes-11]
MTSFKSKIFNFLLRNRHLFQGKLKKETFDFNSSIAGFRELCEKGATRYAKIPKEITIKEQIIEGIKSEWLIPDGANPEKLIFYVHGGGYVSGSCSDHRAIIAKFAKNTGFINLVYEYRLAPENPFPAAVDDSVKVYQWLLTSGFKPENILIAGESAGGGLCLAILLALKERNIALPVAAVAISPWTDLTCSSDSYRTKNKVSLAPLNSWTVFSKYYIGENQATHPLISPLFGDLEGLPPILINSGVDDELFEDGEKFFLKAKEAGVDITFTAGIGMVHCYPLLAPMFPEATQAMNEIVDFTRKHLNR